MDSRSVRPIVVAAILFLFFLQLITDFVASIYALNLLAFSMGSGELAALFLAAPEQAAEQVMMEILRNLSTGLILLSPLLLVLAPRRLPPALAVVLAQIVIACRLASPLLPTRARMFVAGLGTGCFLILLPLWARRALSPEGETGEEGALSLGIGLALALLLSIVFRTLGRGVDLSAYQGFQALGWGLGAAAAALCPAVFAGPGRGIAAESPGQPAGQVPERIGRAQQAEPAGAAAGQAPAAAGHPPARLARTTGVCVGLMGIIALIYFAFASPTVVARWSEGHYPAIVAVTAAATAAFVLLGLWRPQLFARLTPGVLWAWNGGFVLAVFLSVRLHQLPLPANPGAYPLLAPGAAWAAHLPVFAMLLLSPVILVDFALLVREIRLRPPTMRTLGAGFAIACLLFLVLILAVIATTIWDYIPAVGPLFRDRVHLVFLVTALAAAAPALLISRHACRLEEPRGGTRPAVTAAVGVLLAAAITGAFLGETLPPPPAKDPETLTVLSYNIQAGCDTKGRFNFDGQLGVLRDQGADLIGLQESDTCRIAGGNTDAVRFLANRLGYHSYFGPKTVTGTFGIALLSRYPIEEPRTVYLWSEGEQTAAIEAWVRVGTKRLLVFVTHLGNYGPLEQQRNLLSRVPLGVPVILMGDFNFPRDSEQYDLTTAVLEDGFRLAPRVQADEGRQQDIDHIFVSPGTAVLEYRYAGGGNSDHPAAVAVLRL